MNARLLQLPTSRFWALGVRWSKGLENLGVQAPALEITARHQSKTLRRSWVGHCQENLGRGSMALKDGTWTGESCPV